MKRNVWKAVLLGVLLLVASFVLCACGCKHENTYTKNIVTATCEHAGYTGDVHCNDCNTDIQTGQATAKLEHQQLPLQHAYDATCNRSGYTGDVICALCDATLSKGVTIPALGHSFETPKDAIAPTCTSTGYTGSKICTVCGYVEEGETLPRSEHDFVNTICTVCGWKEPGLYKGDGLVMNWDDLQKNGYVTVTPLDDHHPGDLIACAGDFSDCCLVVGENVLTIGSWGSAGVKKGNFTELWLPQTLVSTRVHLNDSVKKVVVFSGDGILSEASFKNSSCEEIVLASTIYKINQWAFQDMTALKKINLPEGLTYIGDLAFAGCTSLSDIQLPSTLTYIGDGAFQGSSIQEITLPASVTDLSGCFYGCGKLERLDMSLCEKITVLGGGLGNCSSLKELRLPPFLTEMSGRIFDERTALEDLVLPETFVATSYNELLRSESIRRVWWPVSLVDGTIFSNCPLEEIYYYGTEAQWSMVGGHDLFPNARITFNAERRVY